MNSQNQRSTTYETDLHQQGNGHPNAPQNSQPAEPTRIRRFMSGALDWLVRIFIFFVFLLVVQWIRPGRPPEYLDDKPVRTKDGKVAHTLDDHLRVLREQAEERQMQQKARERQFDLWKPRDQRKSPLTADEQVKLALARWSAAPETKGKGAASQSTKEKPLTESPDPAGRATEASERYWKDTVFRLCQLPGDDAKYLKKKAASDAMLEWLSECKRQLDEVKAVQPNEADVRLVQMVRSHTQQIEQFMATVKRLLDLIPRESQKQSLSDLARESTANWGRIIQESDEVLDINESLLDILARKAEKMPKTPIVEFALQMRTATNALKGQVYQVYEMRGRLSEKYPERVFPIPGEPKNAYSIRADDRWGRGDYVGAIADFTEAIRLEPENAVAYVDRGACYSGKGEPDRAIADCTEALRLDPTLSVAHVVRGRNHGIKEDFDAAISDFTEAIRLVPTFAEPYFSRAEVYHRKGLREKAIADCTEAIQRDPKHTLALRERAAIFHEMEEWSKCFDDVVAAIRLDPRSAVEADAKVDGKARIYDLDSAIADVTSTIQRDPNDCMSYVSRALVQCSKGNLDAAVVDLSQAIRLAPDDAELHLLRGYCFQKKNDASKAEEDFAAAKRLKSK